MNPRDPNIQQLQLVAKALGHLRERLVFVGGCATGVLNFPNKWYSSAIKESVRIALPDSEKIRLITAPYFIATKLEAFYDRGGGDYMSHDIEDILNVIDGRPQITHEIAHQRGLVAAYLKSQIDELISDNLFLQALPAHFLPNSIEQQRVPLLLGRLREIAGL